MLASRLLAFSEIAMYCLVTSFLFTRMHVPAAPLLGCLVATSLAGWLGRPVDKILIAKGAAIACVGLVTGTSLSPDVFQAAQSWPLSLFGLVLMTCLITATNYFLFRRVGQESRETSFFSSVPGAMSAVLILVEDSRADLKKVLFAQLCRVLALLSIAPFYFASRTVERSGTISSTPAAEGMLQWGIVLGVSIIVWLLLRSRRIAIAAFLGPLVGAGILSLSGLVSVEVHPLMIKIAGGSLGMIVGARLGSARLNMDLKFIGLSVLALLLATSLGCVAGAVFGVNSGVGAATGVLAFAPGSMELMVALGVSLDANVAYIVFHHLVRVIGLMMALPLLYGWFKRTP